MALPPISTAEPVGGAVWTVSSARARPAVRDRVSAHMGVSVRARVSVCVCVSVRMGVSLRAYVSPRACVSVCVGVHVHARVVVMCGRTSRARGSLSQWKRPPFTAAVHKSRGFSAPKAASLKRAMPTGLSIADPCPPWAYWDR